MKYFLPLAPFVYGWMILLSTAGMADLALVNGSSQLLLFALVVCWPIWKTGRLSYVDIGWPWGLVVIGVLTYAFSEGHWLRVLLISGAYVFAGLRMGLGALKMWTAGRFKKELPRYRYQRMRWQRAGKANVSLALQVEALVQGFANASFLAFPAFVIGSNPGAAVSVFEIAGLAIWILAFVAESLADMQKYDFLRATTKVGERNRVCDVGLWRYTRHPNYFAEWMVWNALVIASVPSWLALYSSQNLVVWLLLGAGLLFVSRILYSTLVYYTGAVPAEYFSVRKRPEYEEYKRRTNMFFPGPPRLS